MDAPPGDYSDVPETLNVICGPCQGVLLVRQGRIVYQGQEISPTEFEKLGGKGSSKKWKNSVRVLLDSGNNGHTVGEWLSDHGVDIRNNQFYRLSEGPPLAQPAKLVKTSQLVSSNALADHLDNQYVGLLQGDPSLGDLPDTVQSDVFQNGGSNFDLQQFSYQELIDVAGGTVQDPVPRSVLPSYAGVLQSRVAYVSGHEPSRRPKSHHQQTVKQVQVDPGLVALGQYLQGLTTTPPYPAMGVKNVPLIGGNELDIRKLYRAASELGGFDSVSQNKQWTQVAAACGIDTSSVTNAGINCRNHYQRLLLRYEQNEEAVMQYIQGLSSNNRSQGDFVSDPLGRPGSAGMGLDLLPTDQDGAAGLDLPVPQLHQQTFGTQMLQHQLFDHRPTSMADLGHTTVTLLPHNATVYQLPAGLSAHSQLLETSTGYHSIEMPVLSTLNGEQLMAMPPNSFRIITGMPQLQTVQSMQTIPTMPGMPTHQATYYQHVTHAPQQLVQQHLAPPNLAQLKVPTATSDDFLLSTYDPTAVLSTTPGGSFHSFQEGLQGTELMGHKRTSPVAAANGDAKRPRTDSQ